MKRLCLFFLLIATQAFASPSSMFWTVCTTDIQAFGHVNINVDNFFALATTHRNDYFAPDVGPEFGVLQWGKLKAEAGFDFLGGTKYPWFFNAKIGFDEEGWWFEDCPTFNVGIFNVGTKAGITNANIVDFIVGKNIGKNMRVFAAYYKGARAIGKDRAGYMLAAEYKFWPAKDCQDQDYNRLIFYADYASGKNSIGGGGFALTYFFNANTSIETGPVWFNDGSLNGNWKWSIQFDWSFSVRKFLHKIHHSLD